VNWGRGRLISLGRATASEPVDESLVDLGVVDVLAQLFTHNFSKSGGGDTAPSSEGSESRSGIRDHFERSKSKEV
jgi:hypothetical protein